MPHIQGANRYAVIPFPPILDDYIAVDNPVRVIDAFVDQLDLQTLGFIRTIATRTGRPAYQPGDLVKLYIYGYLNRTRSSRLLERETQRNVEVMWLLKQLPPDFKTIANFRKDNLQPIQAVCREFTLLCKELDLFGGELVAIDGSKFKAVNNRTRNMTPKKVARVLAEIDTKIATYLAELEQQDAQEPPAAPPVTDLAAKLARLQERRQPAADAATQTDRGAPVWDDETGDESRVFFASGAAQSADGDEFDGVNVQSEAGGEHPGGQAAAGGAQGPPEQHSHDHDVRLQPAESAAR